VANVEMFFCSFIFNTGLEIGPDKFLEWEILLSRI